MSRGQLFSNWKQGRREFLKTGAAAAAALLTSAACPQAAKVGDVYLPAGTKKMAALLRRIYEQTDWKADPDKTARTRQILPFSPSQSANAHTTSDGLAGDGQGAIAERGK